MKKAWRNLQENDNAYRMMNDSINRPFNYDSWEASAYDEVVETSGWKFIHGELIFTITNEDLE
jgi:hypothetical protein